MCENARSVTSSRQDIEQSSLPDLGQDQPLQICLQVCPPLLAEFQDNIFAGLIAVMNGKGWRRSLQPDGMPPML